MEILSSAYCCSPFEGSEHYAGHNFVGQIGRHNRVTVLVPTQLRDALGRWRHADGITFEYVETPLYVPWERAATGNYVGPAVSYYLFSVLAYLHAQRLNCRRRFDVVHHVTIANYRFPSLLPFLGIPSVLGPLGGGEVVPAGLEVPSAYVRARRLSLELSKRDPVLEGSLTRSKRLLVANMDTAARIGPRHEGKVELMTYGFHPSEVVVRTPRPGSSSRISVLCVSRLVRHKGIDLLIRAVPEIAAELNGRIRVQIYGEGGEAARLTELARITGADRHVQMHRKLDRESLLKLYAESDIFCFPSLRDTCPVALLEAMAAGLPVIVLDHSGPGFIVTDECGVRVPATNREQTVEGLAEAVCRLAKDSDLRTSMGRAGRARILRDFRWDDRGDRLAAVYREISEDGAGGVGS